MKKRLANNLCIKLIIVPLISVSLFEQTLLFIDTTTVSPSV